MKRSCCPYLCRLEVVKVKVVMAAGKELLTDILDGITGEPCSVCVWGSDSAVQIKGDCSQWLAPLGPVGWVATISEPVTVVSASLEV